MPIPTPRAKAKTVRRPAVAKAAPKKPVAKKTAAPKKPAPKKVATRSAVAAKASAISPLCKALGKVLDTNKAEEIVTLSLKGKCSFADYMIVASGRSSRHVAALADYVAKELKQSGQPLLSVEGKEMGDWVLIDAGDIVVHIFRPEVRQFYHIEKMWALPAVT